MTGLKDATDDVVFAVAVEIAHVDIDPGDVGIPARPEGSRETGRSIRDSDPPLAGLQDSANDIGVSVAVEVAGLHIDPGNVRIPAGP